MRQSGRRLRKLSYNSQIDSMPIYQESCFGYRLQFGIMLTGAATDEMISVLIDNIYQKYKNENLNNLFCFKIIKAVTQMATIRKRNNSYVITVSCGYDITGKQIRKNMTYTPEPGMTAKQIDKEVQRQAALFEDNCVKGKVLNENIRFSEFAALWFADRKNDLRPRTYERYEGMLPRINAAIGHI